MTRNNNPVILTEYYILVKSCPGKSHIYNMSTADLSFRPVSEVQVPQSSALTNSSSEN